MRAGQGTTGPGGSPGEGPRLSYAGCASRRNVHRKAGHNPGATKPPIRHSLNIVVPLYQPLPAGSPTAKPPVTIVWPPIRLPRGPCPYPIPAPVVNPSEFVARDRSPAKDRRTGRDPGPVKAGASTGASVKGDGSLGMDDAFCDYVGTA